MAVDVPAASLAYRLHVQIYRTEGETFLVPYVGWPGWSKQLHGYRGTGRGNVVFQLRAVKCDWIWATELGYSAQRTFRNADVDTDTEINCMYYTENLTVLPNGMDLHPTSSEEKFDFEIKHIAVIEWFLTHLPAEDDFRKQLSWRMPHMPNKAVPSYSVCKHTLLLWLHCSTEYSNKSFPDEIPWIEVCYLCCAEIASKQRGLPSWFKCEECLRCWHTLREEKVLAGNGFCLPSAK